MRFPLLTAAILALACLVEPSTLAQETRSGPRPIGAGGFPVSFTHASAWFGHRADSERKLVTLLVFFEGTPGWHDQRTDFKWEVNQSPAKIEMSVGETQICVKYSAETADVEIQGSKFNLFDSNVFLVQGVDGSKPTVRALGTHDLSFAPDDLPPVALLKRNPEVWAALTGKPTQEHSGYRGTNAPQQLDAWDSEGVRLLLSENPEAERKACDLFRRAADKGYAPSQYRLGYCYESGHGIKQDFALANEWYEKAATQGHVDAQYKLGHSYRVGRGVAIDLPTALRWYKKAAENGDREALHNVGWMYATGQGVDANPEEAFTWFVRAARGGEASSQFEVARRLRDGDGAAKDLTSAYAWLLVLRAQRTSFVPEAWEQVKDLTQSLESQLGSATKAKAREQSQSYLQMLATHEMESFARP